MTWHCLTAVMLSSEERSIPRRNRSTVADSGAMGATTSRFCQPLLASFRAPESLSWKEISW